MLPSWLVNSQVLLDQKENVYTYDNNKETILKKDKTQNETELGNGKIVIKASYRKATKTKDANITVTTELTPDYEKDYEIIPFVPNEIENQQHIADFMAKYITKPFRYIDNTVGVEINFNKVFYQPEQLRALEEITSELDNLNKELIKLESIL